jgi:cell division protein FtsN
MYKDRRLDDARTLYVEAAELKPDETWPAQRIATIDSLSRQIEFRIRYDEKIQKGDLLFSEGQYLEASQYYFEAVNIMPDEDYPINQIKKIQNIMNETEGLTPEKKAQAKVQTPTPSKAKVSTSTTTKSTGAVLERPAKNKYASGKYYHVVVGVFADHNKAERLKQKMITAGNESQLLPRSNNMQAVTFGSYDNIHSAFNFLEFVKNDINKNAWVLYQETK